MCGVRVLIMTRHAVVLVASLLLSRCVSPGQSLGFPGPSKTGLGLRAPAFCVGSVSPGN